MATKLNATDAASKTATYAANIVAARFNPRNEGETKLLHLTIDAEVPAVITAEDGTRSIGTAPKVVVGYWRALQALQTDGAVKYFIDKKRELFADKNLKLSGTEIAAWLVGGIIEFNLIAFKAGEEYADANGELHTAQNDGFLAEILSISFGGKAAEAVSSYRELLF